MSILDTRKASPILDAFLRVTELTVPIKATNCSNSTPAILAEFADLESAIASSDDDVAMLLLRASSTLYDLDKSKRIGISSYVNGLYCHGIPLPRLDINSFKTKE